MGVRYSQRRVAPLARLGSSVFRPGMLKKYRLVPAAGGGEGLAAFLR
jgi:hypothetical protein